MYLNQSFDASSNRITSNVQNVLFVYCFFIDTQNIVREKSASMSCGCVSVFHTIDFMNGEDCEDVRMRLVGARSRG